MKKFILIVSGVLFCASAYAASITAQGSWVHTPNSNYGDGAGTDVRLETPLYGPLNIGLEAAYAGPMNHYGYGDLSGGGLLGELIYYPEVSFFTWKPYLLGGLGWYWWHFDRNQDMKDKGIEINVGDSFTEKVGVGADFPINKNWSFNIEWSYLHSNVPKKSFYSADGSFANVAGGSTVGEEETTLTAGLRYKW